MGIFSTYNRSITMSQKTPLLPSSLSTSSEGETPPPSPRFVEPAQPPSSRNKWIFIATALVMIIGSIASVTVIFVTGSECKVIGKVKAINGSCVDNCQYNQYVNAKGYACENCQYGQVQKDDDPKQCYDPCKLQNPLSFHERELYQIWNISIDGSYEYKLDDTKLKEGCSYKVFNFNDELNPISNSSAVYNKASRTLKLSNVKNETVYKLKSEGTPKEFSGFFLTTDQQKKDLVSTPEKTQNITYCSEKNFAIKMPKYFASYIVW